MLPLDRLRRAGATEDEIAALQELPEPEQLSIEQELQPVAESGVLEFLERYRRVHETPAEESIQEERAGATQPVDKPTGGGDRADRPQAGSRSVDSGN